MYKEQVEKMKTNLLSGLGWLRTQFALLEEEERAMSYKVRARG